MNSKKLLLLVSFSIISWGSFFGCRKSNVGPNENYQYIIFPLLDEFFTNSLPASNFDEHVENAVKKLISKVGTTGTGKRKLGFITAIPIWDTTHYQEVNKMVSAFTKACIHNDVAIYFLVPSILGWESRPELWNYSDASGSGYNPLNKNNVEWSDWQGTAYPHVYRDWGTPEELPPPMCYNCPAIKSEISRAINKNVAPIINDAIKKMNDAGKSYLFAGVTMGDEQTLNNYSYVDSVNPYLVAYMTQQNASKIATGFNALTQNGYSAANPPGDFADALAQVNRDFVSYCCMLLNNSGIPRNKIYTHIAAALGYPGTPQLSFSNAPLSTAFNDYSIPGFTTYILNNPKDLSLIYAELKKQKETSWASTEANPNISEGITVSDYIKMHFDHGATIMVLNVGATSASLSNKLYQGVYGSDAINAYYSFLENR